MLFFQEIPQVQVVERIQEQIVDPIEVLPHERVQQFTTKQIVHMPVPQTQEESAVTDLMNPPISITAVEVVDSFSVSEEVATLADMTTLNTSSTSTSSSAHVCNCEETTSRDRLDALASLTHALSSSLLWRLWVTRLRELIYSPDAGDSFASASTGEGSTG